ncbi:out at first protein isoform X1 [Melanaphis sacchari]|uniref:Out at first protein n=1 Tax=Melanaphis sacchari TaxID=742174 RepID=A0A2H8TE87_9HEMI|nr:out at first protein isoform X1 [Melanaphis sacchari]
MIVNVKMNNIVKIYFYIFYIILHHSCQFYCLVVNVKDQDGGVIKEIIYANITDDTITVELQLPDSTLITQHIDFIKEVQIVQVLLLGEEERGQKPYQILCFVNHVQANEFISPDAMSKLRQKNPGTIRVAEDNKGVFNVTIDMRIKLKNSIYISQHVGSLCSEALDTTFTSKVDIDKWATVPGMYLGNLLQAVEYINYKAPNINLKLCRDTGKVWSHCLCTMKVSIPWYPCALKFCKDHIGKKSTAVDSYRCGIQTCSKIMNFMYSVKHKQHCLTIE